MAKRRLMLHKRHANTGGVWLSIAVIVLTVAACLLISPPQVADVASIFSNGSRKPVVSTQDDGVVRLGEKSWFLIISDSKAVAACNSLIEAEIVRASYGELASIQAIETEEIAMTITASPAQMDTLRKGADILMESFDSFERMTNLSAENAAALAQKMHTELAQVYDTMEAALSGTQNAVVRGLMGLVGSCKEIMANLTQAPTSPQIHGQYAGFVQQYEAYALFLTTIV